MAELPEHVKAQTDAEVAATGARKMPVQDVGNAQAVDNYGDKGKELDAMREQKREDLAQEKAPEPTGPDKE